MTETVDEIPALTWAEVRDDLVANLRLEDDWISESEEELTWQAWQFPTTIRVTDHLKYADGSGQEGLRITVTTPIARVEEPLVGCELAASISRMLAVGSVIWADGLVQAQASVELNPSSRSLLTVLQSAVLTQSTIVHEVASDLSQMINDGELVPIDFTMGHPVLGRRDEPAGLLRIYWGDNCDRPGQTETMAAWFAARPALLAILSNFGYSELVTDGPELVFGDNDIIVRVTPVTETAGRYGQGLQVVAFANRSIDKEPNLMVVNDINSHAALTWNTSHLGYVSMVAAEGVWMPVVSAFLPAAIFDPVRTNIDGMASSAHNAIMHVALMARQFTNGDVGAAQS